MARISLAANPPESPAPAATPEQSLAIGRSPTAAEKPSATWLLDRANPQAHERLGDPATPAALPALLPHQQQHSRSPRLVVEIPPPGGEGGSGGALTLPVEQEGPRVRSRVRVVAEKRVSLFRRVMTSRSHVVELSHTTPSRWLGWAEAVRMPMAKWWEDPSPTRP
jgi:hypothetical protein